MGISFLLIDMKTPGISIKRITTIEGGHEVNDVFLDNVKVPVENRVHEENKGWDCAKALLVHERTSLARVADSRVKLAKLRKMASTEVGDDGRPLIENASLRRKLTLAEVELEGLAMTQLRVLSDAMAGKEIGPESSIFKIKGSEVLQLLTELAVEIVGNDAWPYIVEQGHNSGVVADHAVNLNWDYLNYRKLSIFGGSNEIQRNIISKAVLGLR
jgi:alkylation response protein AidB-like acyl-CoA dehydrogenase